MAWLVPWVANCFVLSLFAKKRIIPRSQQQTKSFQDIEPKVLFLAGKNKKSTDLSRKVGLGSEASEPSRPFRSLVRIPASHESLRGFKTTS